jgi:hypothetical protein
LRRALAATAFIAAAMAPTASAFDAPAQPGTLGSFHDGQGLANPLDIKFDIPGLAGAPSDVKIFISGTHGFIGEVDAYLIAPDGTEKIIFYGVGGRGDFESGESTNLNGAYTFSDSAPASPTFWEAAANADIDIPPGTYRAALPTGENTLITPAFSGIASPSGTWTLRLTDAQFGTSGQISAAVLSIKTPPPPAPTLTGTSPGSPSGSTTPRIVGNSPAGLSVKLFSTADCSGSPLATGTSAQLGGQGIAVTVAPESTTEIRAQAIDADNQTSPCSAPISYVAKDPVQPDTDPPETTIKRKPTFTGPKHSHFAFRSSEPGSTFRCSLDGAPFRTCKSPLNYRNLKKGRHVFRVAAVDSAGNVDPTPAKVRFRIRKSPKR